MVIILYMVIKYDNINKTGLHRRLDLVYRLVILSFTSGLIPFGRNCRGHSGSRLEFAAILGETYPKHSCHQRGCNLMVNKTIRLQKVVTTMVTRVLRISFTKYCSKV